MKNFNWTEFNSFCHSRKTFSCSFNEDYHFNISENENKKYTVIKNNYCDDEYILGFNYLTLDEAKLACVKYMEEEVKYLQQKINNILN